MKIKYLQISNVLSFKYYENIDEAPKLNFEDALNIIIGENGSGKSTALEVINFLFKKVLYKEYKTNQDFYANRLTMNENDVKRIIEFNAELSYRGFRLDPNWYSLDKEQSIIISIEFDEIDYSNIEHIRSIYPKISRLMSVYSNYSKQEPSTVEGNYILEIKLNDSNKLFTINVLSGNSDFGIEYISDYNYFKELILLYNLENREDPIQQLYESFTLISSYRNYNAFEPYITLKDEHPIKQIQRIRTTEFTRSLNTIETNEPSIFRLVRLKIAELHSTLLLQKLDQTECEEKANSQDFILAINRRLKIVNLECKIKLIDHLTWQYNFEILDLRRNVSVKDINSLSAGQKAIIHLVFEAYGRGDLKGGVVIIDEPEIHLHYQFQHEYLQVIKDLNTDNNCQYILVTHSEALINSNTINHVKRFYTDSQGSTGIMSPTLNSDQKTLIKILDNTRSTYAFFSKKVLLVEGDTDRYFFKSVIQKLYPQFEQEISVLYMGSKNNYHKWKELFSSFGLEVFCITDFDFIQNFNYPRTPIFKLNDSAKVRDFKTSHPDWESKIDSNKSENLYILKLGDLEMYLGIDKGLPETIDFCNNNLDSFLSDTENIYSSEVNYIIGQIAG